MLLAAPTTTQLFTGVLMLLVLSLHLYTLSISAGRGKNALKKAYLQKALALIDSEMELFMLKIRHPEQFIQSEPTFKSDLHIVPNKSGFGIIGLVEIAFALSLSGFILAADGKPASLTQIARVFEQAFNVSFGNVRERKAQIFRRKSCDRTKTLNNLKTCIDREYIKCNNS